MAIKSRNKVSIDFSMSSMSDLVFLLLIFFMLTSTLISPNAIKLLLPSSSSKTMAKQNVTVYVNDKFEYFVDENKVGTEALKTNILNFVKSEKEATVVLRADKSVPVQYIVNVIDAVNTINAENNTKHKVILATQPNK